MPGLRPIRAWARDFRDRDARAVLDEVTDKMRRRGLVPARDRVAAEIAAVAAQMRSRDTPLVPDQTDVVGKKLEDDLFAFVAEAKRMVPEEP